MSGKELGVQAKQFALANGHRHDRDRGGGQRLRGEFPVEMHVCIAVDGRYHGGLRPRRPECLYLPDDLTPVGMTEWRVDRHDIVRLHPL